MELYDFLSEMAGWYVITPTMESAAKRIDEENLLSVTDKQDLEEMARKWERGVYDEDPGIVYLFLFNLTTKY
jgi:hypothetical protein